MPVASAPFYACDHHVEIVEGADRDLPHRAAFRRGGVDVVELLEAGGIFEIAEQRHRPWRQAGLRLRRGGGLSKPGAESRSGGERGQGEALSRDRRFTYKAPDAIAARARSRR